MYIFLISRQCVAYLTVICNNCNTLFHFPQGECLVKLNQIAFQQMRVLEDNSDRKLLK